MRERDASYRTVERLCRICNCLSIMCVFHFILVVTPIVLQTLHGDEDFKQKNLQLILYDKGVTQVNEEWEETWQILWQWL